MFIEEEDIVCPRAVELMQAQFRLFPVDAVSGCGVEDHIPLAFTKAGRSVLLPAAKTRQIPHAKLLRGGVVMNRAVDVDPVPFPRSIRHEYRLLQLFRRMEGPHYAPFGADVGVIDEELSLRADGKRCIVV